MLDLLHSFDQRSIAERSFIRLLDMLIGFRNQPLRGKAGFASRFLAQQSKT